MLISISSRRYEWVFLHHESAIDIVSLPDRAFSERFIESIVTLKVTTTPIHAPKMFVLSIRQAMLMVKFFSILSLFEWVILAYLVPILILLFIAQRWSLTIFNFIVIISYMHGLPSLLVFVVLHIVVHLDLIVHLSCIQIHSCWSRQRLEAAVLLIHIVPYDDGWLLWGRSPRVQILHRLVQLIHTL